MMGMRKKTEEVGIKSIMKSPKTACAWHESALQPDTPVARSCFFSLFFLFLLSSSVTLNCWGKIACCVDNKVFAY